MEVIFLEKAPLSRAELETCNFRSEISQPFSKHWPDFALPRKYLKDKKFEEEKQINKVIREGTLDYLEARVFFHAVVFFDSVKDLPG